MTLTEIKQEIMLAQNELIINKNRQSMAELYKAITSYKNFVDDLGLFDISHMVNAKLQESKKSKLSLIKLADELIIN
jgi:hypothetical protein